MDVSWMAVLVSLFALTLFTALNLALRHLSRARMTACFEERGRADSVPRFIARRQQYLLATAIFRSASILVLFLALLSCGKVTTPSLRDATTAKTCAAAFILVLIFGVGIPNAWAKYCGEPIVVRSLPLLGLLRVLCYPLIVVLSALDPVVRRLLGVPELDERSYADELEQEILHAVSEGELHGAVDEEEKEMIESVIEMADTRVDKVMTPRTQIAALPVDADLDAVLEVIRTRGHSRIPVFEQTIDTILGVLYVKDVLLRPTDGVFRLADLMRRAYFVPETKSVRELLREFQNRKVHIAIVLDEYGGTAGLVTIEDILEELVGEITDEFDPSATMELKRVDERTFDLDARMKIHELNDQLGVQLPEDRDFETLGGFVLSTLGRIPVVGERCEFDHTSIHVLAAEPRRILRLRVVLPKSPGQEPAETG